MKSLLIKQELFPFSPCCGILLFVVFLSGCTGILPYKGEYEDDYGEPISSAAGADTVYPGSGYNQFHNVVRVRNYMLDLADRISGLADPQIPQIVTEAQTAAQALDSAMATFNDTPNAHYQLEQALIAAGNASRKAYDMAVSFGLNPPDAPSAPYFSQTFSDVHKTP